LEKVNINFKSMVPSCAFILKSNEEISQISAYIQSMKRENV